jgi:hypothetical protein
MNKVYGSDFDKEMKRPADGKPIRSEESDQKAAGRFKHIREPEVSSSLRVP